MKFKYVWETLIGVVIVLFIVFGGRTTEDVLKEQIKEKEAVYTHYKDSVEQVNKKLNYTLDSLSLVKSKVVTHIAYVPVYVNELSKESDSTIAVKVDSVFKSNTETTTKKDSVFKSMAVTVNTESDSVTGILIHKTIAIDYLASVDLMMSYKSLSQMNQKEISVWMQKYYIENSLRTQSEGLNSDYKNLIRVQDNQIRLYRSVAIGAGVGTGAALFKENTPTVVISAASGFAISYLYDTIKGWIQ